MKEYELIVERIRDRDQEIVQYNSILYTATAAILAFAFDKNNYLFFLLPYVVIFPIYRLSEGTRRFMCRMGAYLYVFHEGDGKEFHWEQRHQAFDSNIRDSVVKEQNKGLLRWYLVRMMARSHYVLITLVCAFLSTYTVIYDNSLPSQKWEKIVFIWILTILMTIAMVRSFTDWPEVRKNYIKKWQAIKAAEDAQKRDSTRNPQ